MKSNSNPGSTARTKQTANKQQAKRTPGQPPKPADMVKNDRIYIRFNRYEADRLRAYAKKNDISISDLIRNYISELLR